jgi:hypothetical protein
MLRVALDQARQEDPGPLGSNPGLGHHASLTHTCYSAAMLAHRNSVDSLAILRTAQRLPDQEAEHLRPG